MSRIPRFNPPNVVKTKHDEELWQRATKSAEQQGQAGNFRYIMGTFMRMKERRGGGTGDYFLAPGETLYVKQRRPRERANPEWAKSLGRGMYRAGDYAVKSARDIVRGIREEHSSRRNPELDVMARVDALLADTSLADDDIDALNRLLAGEDIADALAGTGLLVDFADTPPTQIAQVEVSSGEVIDVPVVSSTEFRLTAKLEAVERSSSVSEAKAKLMPLKKKELLQLAEAVGLPAPPWYSKAELADSIVFEVLRGRGL